MNLVLFDGKYHRQLLPLTYTRPVSMLRIGIFTIIEKWNHYWPNSVGLWTQEYLSKKYSNASEDHAIYLQANVCPDEYLGAALQSLELGQKLIYQGVSIAFCCTKKEFEECKVKDLEPLEYSGSDLTMIIQTADIFALNEKELKADVKIIKNRFKPISKMKGNTVFGDQLFVDEGAVAKGVIFNTETGPIYLGPNSEVMEGSVIRGPFALGEGAVVKMSAKIYGSTTVGPFSKVGGEISNVVFQSYSNKGHDGFLGNSVVGEWCNFGADSNTSNLKNNYSEVKVWNYATDSFEGSGRQFHGVIMGDHSKTGINTMLNTGTVVGVFANIFGSGFPFKFIPSFTWGGGFEDSQEYKLEKAIEVAEKVMERRKVVLTDLERDILSHIFNSTEKYRT